MVCVSARRKFPRRRTRRKRARVRRGDAGSAREGLATPNNVCLGCFKFRKLDRVVVDVVVRRHGEVGGGGASLLAAGEVVARAAAWTCEFGIARSEAAH